MEENTDSLFPTEEMPEVEEEDSEYDTEYRRSVKWDTEKGDFILDGKNQMVECDGQEAFQTWCRKMALTERYTCLAYPEAIGAELEEALEEEDPEVLQLVIERTITEAIETNPRTEYVRDFSFTWNADELICSFVVKGIEMEEEFTVTI